MDLDKYNQLAEQGIFDIKFDLFLDFRRDYKLVNWGPKHYGDFVHKLIYDDQAIITYLLNKKGLNEETTTANKERNRCRFKYSSS